MMRTPKHLSWPILLCLPMGILGAIGLREAALLTMRYSELLEPFPAINAAFTAGRMDEFAATGAGGGGAAATLLTVAAIAGLLLRGRWVLSLLRKACIAAELALWFYAMAVFKATRLLQASDITVAKMKPDSWNVFMRRLDFLWPVFVAAVGLGLLYLFAWCRAPIAVWTGVHSDEPAPGDRVFENLRSHGPDPRYRKSVWSSAGMHVFGVLILPWLLSLVPGCITPYRAPKGSGKPAVKITVVKKVEKKKKKKKLLVNPDSSISFNFPDLNESEVEKTVERESRVEYVADPRRVAAQAAKMGVGEGDKGGWPEGMEDSKVRFIRLKYNGPGWDDGMKDGSRADINFLAKFKSLTPFKVARKGEYHPIRDLKAYPKGYAPPFVYMTGDGGISVSRKDMKILREYLYGGGMLFADCGSRQWDAAFKNFIRQVLPGKSLETISDNDPLFRFPFGFANGPPPLWAHGGDDSKGVKHNGRWVVFYHPGDVNDAWKENRSGMSEDLAEGAMEIGVNIIYYSFTHYLRLTKEHRRR